MQLQQITSFTSSQTIVMSSREIADLTGKEHKNVLSDIRKMSEDLGIDCAVFSAQYKDSTGRSLPCFNLNKELTLTLVAGYNVKLRLAIIKRWNELEQQVNKNVLSMPNFLDPGEAAIAWGMEFKAKQEALMLLEQAKPKVEYVDLFVDKSGLRTITDVAKELGISGKALGKWLRTEGYLWDKKDQKGNSKNPNWTQSFIDKGYGEQKLVLVNEGKMSKSGVFITAKGDLFIKQKYNQSTQ